MTATKQLIATVTSSGSAATIELTSIPQTYTDLYAVYSLRAGTSNLVQATYFIFNDDGTGYTGRIMYGSGSSSASFSRTSSEFALSTGANATSDTFSSGSAYIPNYAGSAVKSVSFDNATENNATSAEINITAATWKTAPITKITLYTGSANFAAGSTVSLYGITKGSGGATV